jgi:tetratricopeptide (TPR) repeat protein
MFFIYRASILLLVCLLSNALVIAQSSTRQVPGADKKDAAPIEAQLKRAVQQAPESFAANHNLGEFYIQQNNLAAAIPYLVKAQQLDPAHYVNSYDLALAYVLVGEAVKARVQIRQALAIKNTAELHHLLGEVEENAGDVPAAAAAYHQAAQLESSEKNLLSLSNLLIKSSNYAEATKFLDYGLRKYPRSAQLKIGLGIAEYSQGKYNDAVKTLCEAADLETSDERPYLFLGEMSGVSVEMTDDLVKRMAQFVKYHPRNALAYYYYAINLRQQQRQRSDAETANDNQIEALLKTAIKLDPKLSMAYFELGTYYADRQQYSAAIPAFRSAVELKPDFEKAHYRLAQSYQRTGQTDLADEEIEIFNRLKKDSSSSKAKP